MKKSELFVSGLRALMPDNWVLWQDDRIDPWLRMQQGTIAEATPERIQKALSAIQSDCNASGGNIPLARCASHLQAVTDNTRKLEQAATVTGPSMTEQERVESDRARERFLASIGGIGK